jgi:hypothetical protein
MPETKLEEKINSIALSVAEINVKVDNIITNQLDQKKEIDKLEERIRILEEQRANDNGFKKGVNWIIALLGGGAGAAITKLVS